MKKLATALWKLPTFDIRNPLFDILGDLEQSCYYS